MYIRAVLIYFFMSYILSIETATPVLSIALHQEGKLVTSIEHHVAQSHSRLLMGMIDYVLKLHNISLQALGAIAISSGPGSYTGLRVGASFAKGLCLGAGLPLIAVDTLMSMVQALRPYVIKGVYCALLDARKGNAYGLVVNAGGSVLEFTKKYRVEAASFDQWLKKQPVHFLGSGAERYREALQSHANSRFIEGIYPKASYMGKSAWDKFSKKVFVDITNFEPLYQ